GPGQVVGAAVSPGQVVGLADFGRRAVVALVVLTALVTRVMRGLSCVLGNSVAGSPGVRRRSRGDGDGFDLAQVREDGGEAVSGVRPGLNLLVRAV
ncbi:MAG TPA: hypothetical protein VHX39_27690, partial [Acetobacteraceae bacterium]|nr:hypothetical protein [Acetobacteraceae bacterium]